MNPTLKIPLVYIAGTGRCGSTILDLLLGSHPSLFSLGEIHSLFWEIHFDRRCACGSLVKECSFWKSIIEKNDNILGEDDLAYFRRGNRGKVIRWKLLPLVFTKGARKGRLERIKEYGEINRAFLRDVLEKADSLGERKILHLIDSSKDPYRLLFLQLSGFFEIKVIHLYKSSYGFVYSMIKKSKGFDRAMGLIRSSGRWLIENKIINRACRLFFPEDTYRLNYRDLAGDPEETLEGLSEFLGISYVPTQKRFREEKHHTISGNKAKFEERGIVLDEEWKQGLCSWEKTAIRILTWTGCF